MYNDHFKHFEQIFERETGLNVKSLNIADFYLKNKVESMQAISNFDCNNGSMNAYLRDVAVEDALSIRMGDEGCSTIIVDDNNNVYGYYTIVPSMITFSDDEKCMCLHISRIAISKDYQDMGLGTRLVKDIFNIAKRVGYRFITLDSFPKKFGWYEKIGFLPFEEINIQELSAKSDTVSNLVYMYYDLIDQDSLTEYYNE